MADPHVCARCAASGPTCCTLTPGQEEFCFPLSEIERHRILEAGAGKGFFAQEANTSAFLDNLRKLFPGEARTSAWPPGRTASASSWDPRAAPCPGRRGPTIAGSFPCGRSGAR